MITNKPLIYQEGNSVYLVLDLGVGTNLYEREKQIDKFMKNETRVLEQRVNRLIKGIFARNGIIANDGNKSALNEVFSALKRKGKSVDIIDLYNKPLYKCEIVGVSKNYMTCQLEEDRYLQCGIEVREVSCG